MLNSYRLVQDCVLVNSIDILMAATSKNASGFPNAVNDIDVLVSEFDRMYSLYLDEIDDAAMRQRVYEDTDGSWKHAMFPLQLIELKQDHANVVLDGVSNSGFVFSISADDWLSLKQKSFSL